MSFGSPNPGHGQPQDPQQPYGYPQQGQPGYGYPQAPGVPPQQGYGYPQAPQGGYPGYPQQAGYGVQPKYANWGQRFLSRLIDSLLFAVPYIVVVVGARTTPILSIIGVLGLVALFVYQVVREGRTGQTIGKKAVGTRTLKEDTGQPLGGGMAFVRQLAHFLDGLPCYIGYLWPAWDAKRQTFADKVCGSIVIKDQ